MNQKKAARGRKKVEAVTPVTAMPDRRLMEKSMAQVGKFLQSREFGSIEEANAALQEMLKSGGLPELTPSTPAEEAQEVIYQALEAKGARRLQLARRALEIDPDCAEAYVLLAEAAKTPREAKDLYEQGVHAGERALGPEIFKHEAGHFWGIVETRPYMRARQGLAEALWALGEHEQAIEHVTDMLRLNPGDNQGLRYLLASWLLAEGRDADLGRLLKKYPDEWSADWAYTRVLYTFRKDGAGPKAFAELQKTIEVNPYVPAYLLGVKELPRRLPSYYGMGDENEAVFYLAHNALNWLNTPGAIEWLAESMLKIATAGKKAGAGGNTTRKRR